MTLTQNEVAKQLRVIADTLDKILMDEGPFILTTISGTVELTEEVTRERILEFHLELVMREIFEIIGEEEEVQ